MDTSLSQFSTSKILDIESSVTYHLPTKLPLFDVHENRAFQQIVLSPILQDTCTIGIHDGLFLHIQSSHNESIEILYTKSLAYADDWVQHVSAFIQQLIKQGVVLPGLAIHLEQAYISFGHDDMAQFIPELINHYLKRSISDVTLKEQPYSWFFDNEPCELQVDTAFMTNEKINHPIQKFHFKTHPYRFILLDTQIDAEPLIRQNNDNIKLVEKATSKLQEKLACDYLADIPLDALQHIDDYVLLKKSRHIVTEQMRINTLISNQDNQQVEIFGELMFHAHASLRNDWGGVIPNADYLVNFTRHHEAGLGAKLLIGTKTIMILALVHSSGFFKYAEEIQRFYHNQTGTACLMTELAFLNA
ncbi:MAG: hypothetical protein LC101_12680 [Flavobacteriales bacterium]|nr:hypothetical protein [Flavobacteriales bacterium]